MVWIPTLKNHKIKDQPEDGCSASKALCNIFLFLLRLPGSAGGKGSTQLPRRHLPALRGVCQVSARAPPPSESRGCGAGPRGGGDHVPLGLAGRSGEAVSEGDVPPGAPG